MGWWWLGHRVQGIGYKAEGIGLWAEGLGLRWWMVGHPWGCRPTCRPTETFLSQLLTHVLYTCLTDSMNVGWDQSIRFGLTPHDSQNTNVSSAFCMQPSRFLLSRRFLKKKKSRCPPLTPH